MSATSRRTRARGSSGVDVEHDFAPEYEIVADRARQVQAIEKAARTRATTIYLATDLDREGEAIAWHVAEAAHLPAERRPCRVTFSEITEPAIREAFAAPARDRPRISSTPSRRGGSWTGSSATRSARSCGARSGPASPPGASSRSRSGSSSSASGRSARSSPSEYWTIEVLLADGGRRDLPSRTSCGSTARSRESRDAATARAPSSTRSAGPARRHRDVSVRPSKRNPAPPFTTSTLQQEASRKLGFCPKRTMSVAQRLYEGVDRSTASRSASSPTCGPTRSRSRRRRCGEARRVVVDRFGDAYGDAQGPPLQDEDPERPGGARGDPPDLVRARPGGARRGAQARRGAALPADLAAGDRQPDGRRRSSRPPRWTSPTDAYEPAGDRHADASSTASAGVYTEGRDDGEDEREATLPALARATRRRSPTEADVPTSAGAALHRAAAAVHGGLPHQGARGARASAGRRTYAATISTIVDRGYVTVQERRLQPEPVGEIVTDLLVEHFGEFVDVAFTARMEEELDEVARGERAVGAASCATSTCRSARSSTSKRRSCASGHQPRLPPTRASTDEVCSEGHPMVIRARPLRASSSRARSYPGAQGERPLPTPARRVGSGRDARGEQPDGVGEPCPECGATDGGTLVAKRGRFGPFVGCDRYPDCRYIKKDGPPPPAPLPVRRGLPALRARVTRGAPRAPAGLGLLGLLAVPQLRLHDLPEPIGRVHDADGAAVAATRRRAPASASPAARRSSSRRGRVAPRDAARRRRARPRGARAASPAHARRVRRPARDRPRGRGPDEGIGTARRAAGGGAPRTSRGAPRGATRGDAAGPATRAATPTGPDRASDRGGGALDGTCAPSPPATPPPTRCGRIATAIGAYLALARRRRRRLAQAVTARAAGLPRAAVRPAAPGRPSRSGSPPSGPSTGGPRADGLAPGDPWAAIATPRLPRRLPAVAGPGGDRAAHRRARGRRAGRRGAPTRSATALALRDRALVETAYAAGLRISELAAATVASARPAARARCGCSGKGRKERIGLLGRPARDALAAYLDDGRPVLLRAARAGAGDAPEPRALPQQPRRAARRARAPVPAGRSTGGRPASPDGVTPAHAAAQLRDPPARRRRRPARRPGAARAREPRHDAGVHARLAGAPAAAYRAAHPRASATGARPRRDVGRRALARAGLIVTAAFFASRVLGWVRLARHLDDLRRRPRARRVLRGLPDPRPDLPARRRGRARLGADPGARGALRPGRDRPRLAGRLDGREPDAPRARCPRCDRLRARAVDHPARSPPGSGAEQMDLTDRAHRGSCC